MVASRAAVCMGEKPFLQAIEKIMKGTEITVDTLEKVYELSADQKKQITATILKYKEANNG